MFGKLYNALSLLCNEYTKFIIIYLVKHADIYVELTCVAAYDNIIMHNLL